MLEYNGEGFVVFLQKSMFMISNNGGKSNNGRNTFKKYFLYTNVEDILLNLSII
jgi:hypothetical protein